MILLIDNFDSFTYNIYQELTRLGEEVKVKRNNVITIPQIDSISPKAIILSPGPGTPDETGICPEIVHKYYQKIPILGVCLGHQIIGACFGASVKRAAHIRHGKTSTIHHSATDLFNDITTPFQAMRYHSLVLKKDSLPTCLIETAWAEDDGEIMAIQHRDYPVYGLQFHPESIGTPEGNLIMSNFLKQIEREETSYV